MRLDGHRALRARERLGYSAADAAREAGIATNSVLRAEHGEDIRPVTARKLAAGLGVQVADLIRDGAELSGKAPGPARQPEHEEAPAGPSTGWEASQETGELLLKSWEEELRRWDKEFPADKIPSVFDYGKLIGWAHGVVRVIQYHEVVARRDPGLTQRGEVADMLGRMEDAKQATLRVVQRVYESVKTNAAFREILETSDMLFSSNNAENDD